MARLYELASQDGNPVRELSSPRYARHREDMGSVVVLDRKISYHEQ